MKTVFALYNLMRQNRSTSEGVLITTVFLVFFSYTIKSII
jgi:hypothetical protein